MDKILKKWVWTIVGFLGVISSLIMLTIISLFTGEFNFSAFLGFLVGFIIIAILNVIRVKTKKDETPSIDERTIKNIKKFYAVSPHVYLAIIIVCMAILTIMGIESISITYLWLVIMLYLLLCGIGSLILNSK